MIIGAFFSAKLLVDAVKGVWGVSYFDVISEDCGELYNTLMKCYLHCA